MILYRLLKTPFFGKYRVHWKFPASENPENWKRLEIQSDSKAKLTALFGESNIKPAVGNVIMAHPVGKEAKGFFIKNGHASFLRDRGFNVMVFDFNGFGESEEGNFDYPADILAAGNEIQKIVPELPVALIGASFGAGWSICALSRGHNFSTVVIEGCFTTLAEYWQRYPFAHFVLKILSKVKPELEKSLRSIAQISTIKNQPKMLFVYGEDDNVTPTDMGTRLISACNLPDDNCTFWKLPKIKHTRAFIDSPLECKNRYVQFMNSTPQSGAFLSI